MTRFGNQSSRVYELLLTFLWLAVCIVAIVVSLKTGRTVSGNYYDAALHWLNGQHLYTGQGGGFIYLPQSAVLYTPFALFPFWLSEVLWRLVNWGLIFYGVCFWLKLYAQGNFKRYTSALFLFSLFFIPIAFSSLRNGQMNMILVSGGLWFFAAFYKEKFWIAALILMLAFFLKPTIAVLCGLGFCLYPRIRFPVLCWGVFFLVLPFVTNIHWAYVVGEYQSGVNSLVVSANVGSDNVQSWAQLFNFLSLFSAHEMPNIFQTLLRVIFAMVTLLMAIRAKKHYEIKVSYLLVYALFAAYLMLFNPRTENNDYIILAAGIAFMGVIFIQYKNVMNWMFMLVCSVGIIFSSNISMLLTPMDQSWVTPLVALLCYIYLCVAILLKYGSSRQGV